MTASQSTAPNLRKGLLLVLMLGLWLAGCATPELAASFAPHDAQLYVDGRLRARPKKDDPKEPLHVRLKYYGSVTISTRQRGGVDDYRDDRRQLTVDEPFPPWFFPLDFLFEVVAYPFASDSYRHELRLDLEKRPDMTIGTTPPGVDALMLQADAALVGR